MFQVFQKYDIDSAFQKSLQKGWLKLSLDWSNFKLRLRLQFIYVPLSYSACFVRIPLNLSSTLYFQSQVVFPKSLTLSKVYYRSTRLLAPVKLAVRKSKNFRVQIEGGVEDSVEEDEPDEDIRYGQFEKSLQATREFHLTAQNQSIKINCRNWLLKNQTH